MMIPDGWAKCNLGELLTVKNGFAFKSSKYQEEGVPVVRISDIKEGIVNTFESKKVEPSEDYENYTIATGDILIAMSGATTGKFGIFKGITKAYQNQRVGNLKPFSKSSIDKHFIFYLLFSLKRKIEEDAYGGAQPNISAKKIEELEIILPPLNEQKRIVAKIEELFAELDAGITSLQTAQAQLKTYRQALLKHAFAGQLTADWRAAHSHHLEDAPTLLRRIQAERQARYTAELAAWESNGRATKKPRPPQELPPLTAVELNELPELPAGWTWVKIGQLCDVVRGGSPRPAGDPKFYGGNIPFLKVADITQTASPYVQGFTYTIKEAGLTKTRQISPPTLLLSNSGATLGVPKICLIEATMNDGIAAFLGLPEESLLYHYYFWQSKTLELRSIDQGAAQPNLNTDLIQEITFPLCSTFEQKHIIGEIESRLSVVDQLEQTITTALQQAEALRQSILKKAFTGQLVPQDPHDEPAATLLARIRAAKP